MDPDPRIRRSMPLTSIFITELQDANKKLIFNRKFSCMLLFEGTFTSFFKDKKSKRSQSRFFLLNLLNDRRIPMDPDPYLRLMDPDPQHCLQVNARTNSLLRRSGRAVCHYCTAPKTQLTTIYLGDFFLTTFFPDLLPTRS
jgi:hypothetical protein